MPHDYQQLFLQQTTTLVSFLLDSSGRHSHYEPLYQSNQTEFSVLTLKLPFVGTVKNDAIKSPQLNSLNVVNFKVRISLNGRILNRSIIINVVQSSSNCMTAKKNLGFADDSQNTNTN